VVVALPDGRAWLQAVLGALRIGAVAVPLDPRLPDERLAALAAEADPACAVVADGRTLADRVLRPDELDAGAPAPLVPVRRGDLALLMPSSGTTGLPKLVMHAHHDPVAGSDAFAVDVLGLGPGRRVFAAAHGSTGLGLFVGVLRPLGAGATIVRPARRPTPRSVLAAVERDRVDVLAAVPALWAQIAAFLERHPDERDRLRTLRACVSSGERLPPALARRLHALTGQALVDALGSAECGNVVLAARPGDPRLRPSRGVELCLADERGRPVPVGRPGRLCVRAPTVALGYWGGRGEARPLRRRAWLRTEDVLVQEDGAFRFLGRQDDLFVVDGRCIGPVAVEACLHEHPGVSEAAAVDALDAGGSVRVAAFVVPGAGGEEGPTPDALLRLVGERLGPACAPSSVTLLGGLPRLASGKLDRRRLAALAGASAAHVAVS
jgi:acyl-coenzyme A synthetase/AMP-(fatty) acid ligase